jgi:hypothetical protein
MLIELWYKIGSIGWRTILARLPLPMLALAASYGVYTFNLLFVPAWVSIIGAAAFEMTYVGLAVARVTADQRRRASIIAGSAVAVSVIYNTVSGLFHRRPDLLDSSPLWADALLAVLHGLPLAIVAYNVAALLLHDEGSARPARLSPVLAQAHDDGVERVSIAIRPCPSCGRELSPGQLGAAKRWGYCRECKGE